MSMQPDDAARLIEMFLGADSIHRAQMLRGLTGTLKPSTPVDPRRAARAVTALEQAALSSDAAGFTAELADALILTSQVASQIVRGPAASRSPARSRPSVCRAILSTGIAVPEPVARRVGHGCLPAGAAL
jgi:hypothetical protein